MIKRRKAVALSVVVAVVFGQTPPLYSWSQCQSIGAFYQSKQLAREKLPHLTVHSRVPHDGFERFYVSSDVPWLPWRNSYIDAYQPKEIIVRVQLDPGKITNVLRHESPSRVLPTVERSQVLQDPEFEKFVASLLFEVTPKQIRRAVKRFQKLDGWSEKYVGKDFWLREYLQVRVSVVQNRLVVIMRPSIGDFVVHRSTMTPVKVSPWRIPDAGLAVADGLKPLMDMWGAGVESEPTHLVAMRLLKHPHKYLSRLRRAVDGKFFFMFMPYVLAADLIRGISPHRDYSPFRDIPLGIWIGYLLLELLFYSPTSLAFSADKSPSDAWPSLLVGDENMTDWYFEKARWGFDKEGVTVLWSGLAGTEFYERNLSLGISHFMDYLRYYFWNAVDVEIGRPNEKDKDNYDVILIKNEFQSPLGRVYVHLTKPKIRYVLDPSVHLRKGGHTAVFKAMLSIVRNVGCQSVQISPCGIKNIVVDTHGSAASAHDVMEISELSGEVGVTYICESGHGRGCRGVVAPLSRTMNQQEVANQFVDGLQFLFPVCNFAEGENGAKALKDFSTYFRLPERHGRVVAARKVVFSIFSKMIPMQDAQNTSGGPREDKPPSLRAQIRRVLSYKVTSEARKNNHWDVVQLLQGFLAFGPSVTWRVLKKKWNGESVFCSDACVIDLDYRK